MPSFARHELTVGGGVCPLLDKRFQAYMFINARPYNKRQLLYSLVIKNTDESIENDINQVIPHRFQAMHEIIETQGEHTQGSIRLVTLFLQNKN